MKEQLYIALFVIFLTGCTTSLPQKSSAVRVLPSGAWTVELPAIIPAWTPSQGTKMRRKYFQYYSALHAKSINCNRYARAPLSLGVYKRAYQCKSNGSYITADILALGKPW